MQRREFITFLGGGVAAWPIAARAQQPALPVVALVSAQSSEHMAPFIASFRQGLKEAGFIEGQNLAVEYTWAVSQADRMRALFLDLAERKVSAIVAAGSVTLARAAKSASTSIPVVFATGADPVEVGLVASYNRPGGNLTGVSFAGLEVDAKRLGLLRELTNNSSVIGVLIDPGTPFAEIQTRATQSAARALGVEILILNASSEVGFDTAFAVMKQRKIAAMLITPNPYYAEKCELIAGLAVKHEIHAISEWRACTNAGGLISYGADVSNSYRQVGVYTGRILKGTKPSDLPVMQPTKFELVINLKTAKALGIDVPLSLQQRADEVIE